MMKIQTLLGNKHKILRMFGAGLTALAMAVMVPSSAYASVPAGTEQHWVGAYSYTITTWDQSDDYLNIHVTAGPLSAGQCADGIFDWNRDDFNPFNVDHHDARIVRVCQSWSSHNGVMNPDTGGSLQGMQKLALCIGPDNATTGGTCNNSPNKDQVVQGNVNVNVPNNCARAWKKNANGTTVYYSGGASTSCSS